MVCKWYPACPMKVFFEAGRIGRKWVDKYCLGNFKKCKRYWMEEKGISHPDNMLPDGSIGDFPE